MGLVALATACGGSAFEAQNGENAGSAGAAGRGGSSGSERGGDSNGGGPTIEMSEGGATIGDASAPVDADSVDVISSDAPTNCAAPATGDPCHEIPRFTGIQVVDGAGDEFCSIPAFVMTLHNAGFVHPAGAMSDTSRAIVRIGWSPEALHAHVHVDDPKILVATTLYDGDNVQFFIAGDKPSVGNFSGTDDGAANQVLIAPPATPTGAGRASTHYGSPTFRVAARTVEGGYEIELQWPWNGIATPAAVGKTIGLDLLVGVRDLASSVTTEFEYELYRRIGAAATCMGDAQLWCDDLLWCTPTLR
jgi:hypothetical protein